MATFISVVLALLIILISFSIVWLDDVTISQIKAIFEDKETAKIVISACLIGVLEIVYLVLCGIIAIVLGHKSNNHKMVKSIFIGLIIYGLFQSILAGCIIILGEFNEDVRQLYLNNIETLESTAGVKKLMYLSSFIYLIYNIGFYIFGKKMLKKGINVD